MKTLYQAILKTYEQNARSYADDMNQCAYDDGKGNRCVIGHCLSDEDFQMYADSTYGVADLLKAWVKIQGFSIGTISNENLHFLQYVQAAHDSSDDGPSFRESFLENINNAIGLAPDQTLLNPDEVAALKTLHETLITA